MKSKSSLLVVLLLTLLTACAAQQRPDGGKGLLPVGSQVPNFTQEDHRGQSVRLREAVPTLLYFYPRDGTPGCTREACAFRDAWQRYASAGLRVIGVSSDSIERHQEFAKEHELPFALVSDPEHLWSKAFGVSNFIGFDSRVSFLIDAHGHVVQTYKDVDPGVHATQVLDDAKKHGLLQAHDG